MVNPVDPDETACGGYWYSLKMPTFRLPSCLLRLPSMMVAPLSSNPPALPHSSGPDLLAADAYRLASLW